jgi:uncharacterized protein (TIGR04255 family)
MSEKLPKFKNPPVIEVVLGVQFDPIDIKGVHFGWYWKERLGGEWNQFRDAERLPEHAVNFGKVRGFRLPKFSVQFQSKPVANRLQVTPVSGDRMIQVQNTHFVYNWIRKNGSYPSYDVVRREFDKRIEDFRAFVSDAGLGELRQNHWEVTYVNQIPAGELWQEPSEWSKVIPGLLVPMQSYGDTLFENMEGTWRSEIPPGKGRLEARVRHQPKQSEDGTLQGILVLQFTARGPIGETQNLSDGLEVGHRTIVQSFVDLTSNEAKAYWGME